MPCERGEGGKGDKFMKKAQVQEYLDKDSDRESSDTRESACEDGQLIHVQNPSDDKPATQILKLDEIIIEDALQLRDDYDEQVTKHLAERLKSGAKLPPVCVFDDGQKKRLADGRYQIYAMKLLGATEVEVIVRPGDWRDALVYGIDINTKHGTSLSPAEKRKCAMRLLSDPEVSTWSDHRIGDLCALNHKTIARLRKLSGANPQMQARLVERGGVIYEMRLPVRKGKRDAGERIERGADKRAIDPTTEPTFPASRAEEINETWQVSEGDVYVIESQTSERQHIIICGDSGLAETYQPVRSLTSRVGLLVSDVPYNCDIVDGPRIGKRETNSHLAIANDNLNDVDYELILFNALRQAKTFLRPGGSYYCFMSTKHLVMTTDVLTKAIAAPRQFLIWVKDYFVTDLSHYHWGHETCAYGWLDDASSTWLGDKVQNTVFQAALNRGEGQDLERGVHPTPKPLSMLEKLIANSLEHGGTVLDPFMGSGSTLVAAEKIGRVGIGIEIVAPYVAVALQRLKEMGLSVRRATADDLVALTDADGSEED